MSKRFTLSTAVIEHIFRGDNNNGSLSGFHSEARGDATLLFAGDNQQRRQDGLTYVAWATVTVDGTQLGPKKSSFFPHPENRNTRIDNPQLWTEENTKLWLEQGLTSSNPTHAAMSANTLHYQRPLRQPFTAGVGASFRKFKANRVTCYILYQGGVIASIFPHAPGFGEEDG